MSEGLGTGARARLQGGVVRGSPLCESMLACLSGLRALVGGVRGLG